MKTSDGRNKGRIRLYCKALEVSRQAFYDYLDRKDRPWKYQPLVEEMLKIHNEDEYAASYIRIEAVNIRVQNIGQQYKNMALSKV